MGESKDLDQKNRESKCASGVLLQASAPVGVIKKASEVSILCGTHVGIILFSQARKTFSFGHPCIDYVIEKSLMMRRKEEESKKKADNGGGA
jgi:hypothetical protein